MYLISGGFQSIIEPVAEELNIPKGNIIANRFLFYYDGTYLKLQSNYFQSYSKLLTPFHLLGENIF